MALLFPTESILELPATRDLEMTDFSQVTLHYKALSKPGSRGTCAHSLGTSSLLSLRSNVTWSGNTKLGPQAWAPTDFPSPLLQTEAIRLLGSASVCTL